MRALARLEGVLLLGLAAGAGAFTLLGNYAFLMNPRFGWLTLTGAGLVGAMGLAALLAPRRRPGFGGIVALVAMGLVVAVGEPHERDLNALTVPDLPAGDAAPQVRDGVTYEPMLVDELQRAVNEGETEREGRPFLVTGLLKRSPDLAAGQFALMRPVSICCAADALLVGLRAEGEAPADLTDQWVHVYARLRRSASTVERPRLRHGAIRFAVVSETHVLEVIEVVPYVRQRPKEDVFDRLPTDRFGVFVRLAKTADLDSLVAERDGVTVLAPTDAAFDRLPASRLEDWFAGRDRTGLRTFLGRHVLVGELAKEDLRSRTSVTTADGQTLSIEVANGVLRVGGARILFADIQARNGLVHAIHPTLWRDVDEDEDGD